MTSTQSYVGMTTDIQNIRNLPCQQPPNFGQQRTIENRSAKHPILKKTLSAKELTGAPLIRYAPKIRKQLKKKSIEPTVRNNNQVATTSPPPVPGFFVGQNLYHKLAKHHRTYTFQDANYVPSMSAFTNLSLKTYKDGQRNLETSYHNIGQLSQVKSYQAFQNSDNLSDTFSVSSDEMDNFKPRIIKPRRRRKKDKGKLSSEMNMPERGENSCFGSEKQWLPTGLLSAESSFDSRSECAVSSEDDIALPARPINKKKLKPTLSVPAYIGGSMYKALDIPQTCSSSGIGSDYSSLTSSIGDSSPSSPSSTSSSSSDQLFGSDPRSSKKITEIQSHTPLKGTKSTSCSYFRSPKVEPRGVADNQTGTNSLERQTGSQIPLRKTNSWTFSSTGSEFSLFSPGKSCDLLSGVRRNLSRLDLRDTEH